MRSVILLGKGPSILKLEAEYVEGFDQIAIANRPIWKGYEQHIPPKADIQYRNNSTEDFAKSEFIDLGIKTVISTASPDERLRPRAHHNIAEVRYPKWPVNQNRDSIVLSFGGKSFNASSGVVAFYDLVSCGKFSKVGVAGIDLLENGQRAYYFEPEEAPANMQYLFGGIYDRNGFIRKKESGHSEPGSREFMFYTMQKNAHIQFEIATNNHNLSESIKELENVRVL
tara:strand:- start:978 stop:1658 length:681 start_codon:yes stop_codon:yes gene_type:complete